MFTRRFLLGLALALALVLAVRLPLLRCGAFGADVPNFADEANYVWLADSLAAGNTVADTYWFRSRAPATAIVLLGLGWLRGLPPELVVCDFQMLQALLWVAITLGVAAIAATLWGRRTGLIAALLVALLPDAAMLSLLVYSETLFTAALVAIAGALLAWSRSGQRRWLVVAGVAAGIGALARPTMVPLVPVLALWTMDDGRWTMGAGRPRVGARRGARGDEESDASPDPQSPIANPRFLVHRLLPAALLVLTCALVIAPWTIRNYVAYGGLILIDTTGSVVLWSDNKPDGSDTVKDDIKLASANPVERQRFATREALATIGSDPARFARKAVREGANAWGPADFAWTAEYWGDLLRDPRLGALFAHWHSLMLLALPLALLGMVYAPHGATGARGYRLGLAGICLVYTLMIAITHFEERYRTPFMVLLLPYSAWAIAHPRLLVEHLRRPAGLALVALLVALGLFYSRNLWPDQWTSGRALALHGRGILRAASGDLAGALADQQRASALMPTLYEAQVAEAELRAQQGDERGAEQLLQATISLARSQQDEPTVAVVALQRLLGGRGAWADGDALDGRLSIRGRAEAEAALWGRGAAPGGTISLGSADVGLVRGFYQWETSEGGRFRWSRPRAELLLAGQGASICLRLNAARPPEVPAPAVALSADTGQGWQPLGTITPPRSGWIWGCVRTPSHASGAWTLRLETEAYSPFLQKQGSDTRQLGIALAEAVVRADAPTLDAATGLLLDRVHAAGAPRDAALTLVGLNSAPDARAGEPLPLTLWWRGAQPPAPGAFTFVHLLDGSGAMVAAYNAPLAGGAWPSPWSAAEPLADPLALPLPAGLAPGPYLLRAGAFDPASGQVYVQEEFGTIAVR